MILSKFLSFQEIKKYFESNDVSELTKEVLEVMLFGSVADMLYITEQFKKNNLKLESYEKLNSRFKEIEESGVYFPEIDRSTILENMFDNNFQEVTLWNKPCNKKISPQFSISLIALCPNELKGCSEELFTEMEEYYLNYESYD